MLKQLKVNCEDGKPYIAFGIPGARWNKDEETSIVAAINVRTTVFRLIPTPKEKARRVTAGL